MKNLSHAQNMDISNPALLVIIATIVLAVAFLFVSHFFIHRRLLGFLRWMDDIIPADQSSLVQPIARFLEFVMGGIIVASVAFTVASQLGLDMSGVLDVAEDGGLAAGRWLLERVFMLERLPPWHSNRLTRLVKTPKLHMGDTGVACALLGIDAAGLMANRTLLGQLLETFAFQELKRQAGWHDAPLSFFHYRDKDQVEVDIVIERGALSVAGVEVKAAATVTPADFRGLRKLKKAAGQRFAGGVVLYDGELTAGFGDDLYAVPFRRLWE